MRARPALIAVFLAAALAPAHADDRLADLQRDFATWTGAELVFDRAALPAERAAVAARLRALLDGYRAYSASTCRTRWLPASSGLAAACHSPVARWLCSQRAVSA